MLCCAVQCCVVLAKSVKTIEACFCTNVRDAQYSSVPLFGCFLPSLPFLSCAVLSCLQFFEAVVKGSGVGVGKEESARRESTDSMCCTFKEAMDMKKKGENRISRGKPE